MVDIATRVWNHKWKIDPIVRSLIDNDFYKLLMCQSVLRNHPKTEVTFSLINRSSDIRLAELIDEGELREQLDHVRSLSLSRGESTWMRGNTFYGKRQMFTPEFMDWFEALRLPDYHLEKRDGQYELTFQGSWPEVMLWEIPALAVLMELRGRAVLRDMRRFELQILYARAMAKLWEKIETLRDIEDLRLADFGTRRRHSFLWQDWAVQAMTEGLGDKFIGTSNCLIAKNRDLAAIGTNAHELPMIYSALASDDQALRQAPYDVLSDWHEEHDGNLRIILPDTYGTEGFLDNAPDWLATWTGMRIDSGDPIQGAEHAIKWWKSRNEDPSQKLLIFSDGLDVEKIAKLHRLFAGRVRVSFGWGTLLTNDFRGLVPNDGLKPFSLVCKAVSANGKPTVKLSDNPNKAMGPADEIARYKRVFEVGRQNPQSVIV
ncbi:nicotinate phosphoribosyltransferase [Planktomarina sp.]|mgnify:FL=1|jgi:nicotinate phosphoribosyltransferase|uniref:nicotinate phosphoribosyltransferase n=1 Tax=Planktomarina sp. TaxID=2024851 RepID=UPI00231738B7|nr:nicotinate phosphoribosyltransferase [Planktomarina temperata]MDB2573723.1 nicotinate phosphoribosyltransferase [Planktomarina temperata]MDB9809450.1 nicotinate phosphoribosyltransferase [Planktomarina temperata]MDC1182092.1 nicotinate phosphoribosyltransferase [Planktomarina temperata]MDC1274189.1 nicotinate phosphoribosyltransferase [Planktomarina temperata]